MTDTDATTLQRQARALGDPTRHGVFRYVADSDHPVDVAELTTHFGLNHNAIRQHLAKLVEAGLLSERTAAHRGRGRPRLVYAVDPSADSRWGVMGPYERLSLWLTEVIRSGETPRDVGRRVGRQEDLDSSAESGADPMSALIAAMARQGFDPVISRTGSVVDVTLRACPFETAALADPDTVCELHAGLIDGVVERIDGLEVDGLTSSDPRRAQCRLRLRVSS